jgi:DisA bacterial checkpoint controller nucleotide-binding
MAQGEPMSLPAVLALGSFYEGVLQSALRQFFRRALLEIEPGQSPRTEGVLTIEPVVDPSTLCISWAGTRYTLRMPGRGTFTPHQTRMARAIVAVIGARYRVILTPELAAERGELFRGPIEDRYIGAFFDERPYAIDGSANRIDRIASVIEMLRVAALSTYENRPISTGVLLLEGTDDPCRPNLTTSLARQPSQMESLSSIKSFYRLADGVRTVFLADVEGRLLDIIDIDRWSRQLCPDAILDAPGAKAYQAHARATLEQRGVCVVLSPSREIKVFADGVEAFAFHGAAWHLLDLKAKYELWADAVGNPLLALRLFQTALDLADAREGALFVILRDPADAVPRLLAPADRLDVCDRSDTPGTVSRREVLHLLEGRSATDLDASVLSTLATLDGAVVVDRDGRMLAAGAILRHPQTDELEKGGVVEGARTTAAVAASQFGPVLKVSEDGEITFYDRERVWDI